jgi:hypothetical protein
MKGENQGPECLIGSEVVCQVIGANGRFAIAKEVRLVTLELAASICEKAATPSSPKTLKSRDTNSTFVSSWAATATASSSMPLSVTSKIRSDVLVFSPLAITLARVAPIWLWHILSSERVAVKARDGSAQLPLMCKIWMVRL